jgi:hypothetical protein
MFVCEDGTNLHLTGAIEIIKHTIKVLRLNENTCAIFAREQLDIDGATIICQPAINYWVHALEEYLKDVAMPTGPFSKKFAVWYNRGTFLRAKVIKQGKSKHTYQIR